MRVTTTFCGADIHILKGEYPVERGLTIGHKQMTCYLAKKQLRSSLYALDFCKLMHHE